MSDKPHRCHECRFYERDDHVEVRINTTPPGYPVIYWRAYYHCERQAVYTRPDYLACDEFLPADDEESADA